jgi:hypothetical protein
MLVRGESEYTGAAIGPSGSALLMSLYSATTQDPPGEDVVHVNVTAVSLPVPKRYKTARLTEVPIR